MAAVFLLLFSLPPSKPAVEPLVEPLYDEADNKIPHWESDVKGYHSDLKDQVLDMYGHLSSEPHWNPSEPIGTDYGKENTSPERKEEMLRAKFRVFMR